MRVYKDDLVAKAVGILEDGDVSYYPEKAEARAKLAMAYLKAAEILGNNYAEVRNFRP